MQEKQNKNDLIPLGYNLRNILCPLNNSLWYLCFYFYGIYFDLLLVPMCGQIDGRTEQSNAYTVAFCPE